MKATQKPSAGEQIIRWNVLQKTVGKSLKIPDLETQKESSQAVAGETKEGTLDLAADGIRLEAGQYRLKKECRIFDDENSRQTELTAEFQVEP